MSLKDPWGLQKVFSETDQEGERIPKVLISCQRFALGKGVIRHLGRYLSLLHSRCIALLISEEGLKRDGNTLLESLEEANIQPIVITFGGESSYEEIERNVAFLMGEEDKIDSLIAIGGGKCLDAGKSIAYRLNIPIVVCPTIASIDAPCSALSVIYTPNGIFKGVEFFAKNPTMVVVDTEIIAKAPLRYLVAGMGDAMSTWYETRTCILNPQGKNSLWCRPTIAAKTIAEQCAMTLYDYGVQAAEAVKASQVNEALEYVAEANTLLSGIGFESGGLAAAHAVAMGFTVITEVHKNYLHGEMVAIGLLTQLMLEGYCDDAQKVAHFFTEIGLPVHLGHLALDPKRDVKELERVMLAAMDNFFIRNEPFEVSSEKLLSALFQAHELGKQVVERLGDRAYRSIHAEHPPK